MSYVSLCLSRVDRPRPSLVLRLPIQEGARRRLRSVEGSLDEGCCSRYLHGERRTVYFCSKTDRLTQADDYGAVARSWLDAAADMMSRWCGD